LLSTPARQYGDGHPHAEIFGKPFDDSGALAAQGRVSETLLTELLRHPYFAKSIPKSTGREEFGAAFCDDVIKRATPLQLTPHDMLATAAALTAETIARHARLLEKGFGQMAELIVSGGGMHNRTLMAMLQERFAPAIVTTTDDYGLPGDAKEAILFAVLANETVGGFAGNVVGDWGTSSNCFGKDLLVRNCIDFGIDCGYIL
jgi:anhydro-N-acetylmuramic acid kinase